MFFVTLVVTQVNGNKNAFYLAIWIIIGWYGFIGNIVDIKRIVDILIGVNTIFILILLILPNTNFFNNLFDEVSKVATIIGVLVMMLPKIFIYFYCSKKIKDLDSDYVNLNEIQNYQNDSLKNKSYLIAIDEYENQKIDKGLWTRLYVENNGDETKAKVAYLKVRAEEIQKTIEKEPIENIEDLNWKEQVKKYRANNKVDESLVGRPFIPLKPSKDLAKIIGEDEIPKIQALTLLWMYIKRNGLQKSKNIIASDKNLKKLFNKDEFNMFDIAKMFDENLYKTENNLTNETQSHPSK